MDLVLALGTFIAWGYVIGVCLWLLGLALLVLGVVLVSALRTCALWLHLW